MTLQRSPLDALHGHTHQPLRTYTPDLAVAPDLTEFWARTLAEMQSWPLDAAFERVETGLRLVDKSTSPSRGFGGSPIRAWLQMPCAWAGPLPAVVEFVGYGGGRGAPYDHLMWASRGQLAVAWAMPPGFRRS
jgi:cephalosporin-C deacetylase